MARLVVLYFMNLSLQLLVLHTYESEKLHCAINVLHVMFWAFDVILSFPGRLPRKNVWVVRQSTSVASIWPQSWQICLIPI